MFDNQYPDALANFTNELIKRMHAKREEIVNAKLKQLGYSIVLADQAKYRFRDVIVEHVGNEETWWYNDGTFKGQRIITFVNDFPEMKFSNDSEETFKLTNYIKYY